jgi:hypothetical protein
VSRKAALVAAALVIVVGGCGSDDSSDDVPALRVDLIDDAVAAVEAELGGPQQYFEINATSDLVNLYVADDVTAEATSYVYRADGSLDPPVGPGAAEGETFGADAIEVDEGSVLDDVLAELPESIPLAFAVTGTGEGAVQYQVILQSARGGRLAVYVDGDGTILGSDVIEEPTPPTSEN